VLLLVLAKAQPLTPVGRLVFENPEFDSAASSSVLQAPDFLQETIVCIQVAAPKWAWQMFFCFELNF
jgi:hypothetical protein